jgi:hypothetical protein
MRRGRERVERLRKRRDEGNWELGIEIKVNR